MRQMIRFGALAGALLAGTAFGQSAPVALTIHPVTPGKLYWIEGGGGNSGVIIGDKGVIIVDAKTTPEAGAALIAEVAKLTPKPVTHVIITHSDGDHVNGLAGMPDGLQIVAHANNKAEQMAVYQFAAVEVNGGKCLPPANRIPNRIVSTDRVATVIDGVPLVIHHFGPAHTGGDLIIEVPGEKVAFVGDIITSSVLVHPEKSGTFAGWFDNAAGLLKLPVTRYLGGHAKDFDTKATLQTRIAEYRATQAKVDALVDGGKSLDEVKTAMNVPAKAPSGCRGIPYPSLPEVEFNERFNHNHALK
jgi:glyoxylase-like metal-dependent hydrolase (beta-lactamase superfamily II)